MGKLANVRKAVVPLVTAAAALAVQWLNTGSFTPSTELVTALFGVVTAFIVYQVPNLAINVALAGVRKALVPLGTAAAAVIVQWWTTGAFTVGQELPTALLGVLASLFVLWVPNDG